MEDQLAIALKAVQLAQAMHPRPSHVTQTQAAEMLNVSRTTIHRMVQAGSLKLNKCGLIPITEIDKALAA